MTLKIIMLKSIPAAGKTTWAKAEVARDPLNWLRISNDDIRDSFNNSEYSLEYEKLITKTRLFLIKEGLASNKNLIIDNLNLNKRHWEDTYKIAQATNKDIFMTEKAFYVELAEAIHRDQQRQGKAQVGEPVIRKWWKQSGGKQFAQYQPKIAIFKENDQINNRFQEPLQQNISLPKAIIVDIDGTIAIIGDRSPYDASLSHIVDKPNTNVIETVKLFYQAGYQIIFCSGRMEKDRVPTTIFIETYMPQIKYQLFMRANGDQRADSIIKEEIFNQHIRGKYFVRCILDDRNSVVQKWRDLGLTCFQVNFGDF